MIRSQVDDLVSLFIPFHFRAVGLWYVCFDQVSDEEVIGLLQRTAQEGEAA